MGQGPCHLPSCKGPVVLVVAAPVAANVAVVAVTPAVTVASVRALQSEFFEPESARTAERGIMRCINDRGY